MPRTWNLEKERILKEDGRYLVYYRFPEKEDPARRKPSAQETPEPEAKPRAAGAGEGK
jgi:hypothetical protein